MRIRPLLPMLVLATVLLGVRGAPAGEAVDDVRRAEAAADRAEAAAARTEAAATRVEGATERLERLVEALERQLATSAKHRR